MKDIMKTIHSIFQKHLLQTSKGPLLLFLLSFTSCIQKGIHNNKLIQYDHITKQNVYLFVEKMPVYKHSEVDFMRDFIKYFHFNELSHIAESIPTKLKVQFVINNKGKLIGARIYNKSENEYTNFEKIGLRALNSIQNWQPGINNGKNVNVLLTKLINIDPN